MNTSFARFVAYAAGIGSVAEEGIALERDPLATIFVTMRCQPLLLSCAAPNRFEDREVRDGEVDALLLGERKWRQWAKQPIFIYCVQFSHRVLIVVRKASCRGEYLAERSIIVVPVDVDVFKLKLLDPFDLGNRA